jgi:hypothetical protein
MAPERSAAAPPRPVEADPEPAMLRVILVGFDGARLDPAPGVAAGVDVASTRRGPAVAPEALMRGWIGGGTSDAVVDPVDPFRRRAATLLAIG